MSQYTSTFSNRKEMVERGVAIFFHDQYQFKLRKDLALISNDIEVESVLLEITSCSHFGGRNVIIGCITDHLILILIVSMMYSLLHWH